MSNANAPYAYTQMSSHQLMPQLSDRSLVPAQDVAAIPLLLSMAQEVNMATKKCNMLNNRLDKTEQAIRQLARNQTNLAAQMDDLLASRAPGPGARLLPLVQGSLATGGAAAAPAAAPVPAQGAAPGSRVAKRPAHAWNNFTKLYLPKCQAADPKERFKECAAAWKRLSKAQQQAFKAL